jgi:protein SCO1/2
MQLRPFLLITTAVVALAVPRSFAAEQVFDVTGIVRAPLKAGHVVITHEDIPGFMPGMTMGFRVANPAEAATLVVGDRVHFHLRVSETASSAADFTVVSRAGSTEPASNAPVARSRLHEGDRVPAFSLLDQDGQKFSNAALDGHRTIVTFIFSRCPVPEYCPAMALRFGQLQKAILANPKLAGRARLLSITLDPEFDRPKILKAYGAAVGANSAVWRFATGDKTEIDALTKAFAVFTERNGVTLDHTLCTALIGADGRIVQLWRGNGWRIDEVLAALPGAELQ